ncbi:MAG: YlxR family protein [Clostridia bacterium]|nr:YlxR family protein [Clostridia bacterium]
MAKTKSVPMRTCIACREMKPKKEMLRVVRNAEGEIFADYTGKAAGRGAYICNGENCLKKLSDKKLLHKAFSTNVAEGVYETIKESGFGKSEG